MSYNNHSNCDNEADSPYLALYFVLYVYFYVELGKSFFQP